MKKKQSSVNNTYYFYDTLKSYLNMYDPNDTTKFAQYQEDANSKIIILIPYNGMCDLNDGSTYFTIPDTDLVSTFIDGAKSLINPSIDIPITLQNYSIANNVKYLGGSSPCRNPTSNPPEEPPLDVITTGMMSSNCPFEYWVTKYDLLGLLAQIQELAKTKDAEERWFFSLSWGTYDLCANMAWAAEHLDIAQTCAKITYGEDNCSSSSPCTFTNQQYTDACEVKFQDLTENFNCIFFVSSGDTGCVSDDSCYKVDYPTSSKYTISVGGINYLNKVENQSSTNSSYYNLAQKVSPNADGIALPLSYLDRSKSGSIDFTVGGKYDAFNTIMASGGGFTNGDNGNIKAPDAQKPFLNTWFNDSLTAKPSAWISSLEGSPWNINNPQRGTPDISCCMGNGLFLGFSDDLGSRLSRRQNPLESRKPVNMQDSPTQWLNADGTSFSAPLLASFFAVLLSYIDLPKGKNLKDFIYENAQTFDKPSRGEKNTFQTDEGVTCEGFTCTTKSGTWDPCVGLGAPNFLALYNILKNSF